MTYRDGAFRHGATGAELIDSAGRRFDQRIHEVDPLSKEVRPVLTTRGLIRLKRGPPPGTPAPPAREIEGDAFDRQQHEPAPPPESKAPPRERQAAPLEPEVLAPDAPVIGSAANDVAADAFASVIVATVSGAAVVAYGDWAKHEDSERQNQQSAWSAYLRTLDMTTPPPWSIPLIVSIPWIARVSSDPRASSKRKKKPAPGKTEREPLQPHEADPMQFDPPDDEASNLDT